VIDAAVAVAQALRAYGRLAAQEDGVRAALVSVIRIAVP
jgi:hypothetical protein